jgi:hypothetical protein
MWCTRRALLCQLTALLPVSPGRASPPHFVLASWSGRVGLAGCRMWLEAMFPVLIRAVCCLIWTHLIWIHLSEGSICAQHRRHINTARRKLYRPFHYLGIRSNKTATTATTFSMQQHASSIEVEPRWRAAAPRPSRTHAIRRNGLSCALPEDREWERARPSGGDLRRHRSKGVQVASKWACIKWRRSKNRVCEQGERSEKGQRAYP